MEFSCLFATAAFFAANVLRIIYYVKERQRDYDWDLYLDLDPSYLEGEWDFRYSKRALFLASGFLNAIAWLILAVPMIHLAWTLSKGGKQSLGLNMPIAVLAIGGAMTEWLSLMFWIGLNLASFNLYNNFNLQDWVRDDVDADNMDNVGMRSLEINFVTGSGFIWFTDTFEWICLAGIFICVFFSVSRWRQQDQSSFGPRWNNLTLFMGLLSLLEFIAEIFRFEGFRAAGPVAIIYALVNRLILMPAWFLSLGILLPRAAMRESVTQSMQPTSELILTEMSSQPVSSQTTPAAGDTTFTIGDEQDGQPTPSSPPPEAFGQSN